MEEQTADEHRGNGMLKSPLDLHLVVHAQDIKLFQVGKLPCVHVIPKKLDEEEVLVTMFAY